MKDFLPLRLSYLTRFAFVGLLLTVPPMHAAPVITAQPTDKTVRAGETVFFTVTARGTSPLTYQWRRNEADIPGANAALCALGLARADEAGAYSVIVRDADGATTTSKPAVLGVEPVSSDELAVWRLERVDDQDETTTTIAPLSGAAAVAGNFDSIYIAKTDGSLVSFPSEILVDSGVKAISAKGYHLVSLKGDGTVSETSGFPVVHTPSDLNGVTAVAAGMSHTLALKNDGSVVAWGENDFGQTNVPEEALSGVVAVGAGDYHSVALKSDGSVVAWGFNLYGQASVPPEALSGVKAIAAGYHYTAVLKTDGSVLIWRRYPESSSLFTFLLADGGVTAIAGERDRAIALKIDGSVEALRLCCPKTYPLPLEAPREAVAIVGAQGYVAALLRTDPTHPILRVQRDLSGLVLSWPTNVVGFTLQSTPGLSPPVTWTDSDLMPNIVGERFTITNSISENSRFYRLRKP